MSEIAEFYGLMNTSASGFIKYINQRILELNINRPRVALEPMSGVSNLACYSGMKVI